MVIFLVGFMGCGKSTIGSYVAKKMGYDFVDLDSVIEAREGATIVEIFRAHGEEYFRAVERRVIQELEVGGDLVVATGGGAPCFGDNMELMLERGEVVYFKLTPKSLMNNLANGRAKRPKIARLNDEELMEYITTTLAQREHYYSKASITLDCNGASNDYVANHISYAVEVAKSSRGDE